MNTYSRNVEKAQDRVLDVIRQVDEAVVAGVSTVSKRVGSFLPEELPGASLLRNLPKPEEYVRIYWSFVEGLVKTQKTYSQDLMKAFQPITRKIWKDTAVRKAA